MYRITDMDHEAMIELAEKRDETSKWLTLATDLRDGEQVCGAANA